jgi:hypothetical protein
MESMYLTEIEKLFEKYITSEWLENKSNQFKKLDGYVEQEQKVIIRNFENDKTLDENEPFLYKEFVDEETGKKYTCEIENIIKEELIEIESTIITLGDFCWCSDEKKETWASIGVNKTKRFEDLDELVLIIIYDLKSEITNCDRLAAYNIIEKGNLHVQSFFLSISQQDNFKDQKDLLLDLYTKSINHIKFYFGDIYKNHVNSVNLDFLNFNLNRNQLIGLIYLLDKADFFDPPGKQSKYREGKYYFFEKYFKCTDSRTDEKKLLTGISDEFTKIKKEERSDGLHEVYKLIESTYKILTR